MHKFGPIVNGKVTTTGGVLSHWMTSAACKHAALASAYVTSAGVKAIIPSLKKAVLKRGISVRLLTGIKDYFSDPAALASLLNLAQRSKGRLAVKLSRNPRFHAKLYLFDLETKTVCITGSANLTSGGMRVDGELSAQIESPKPNPSMGRFWQWFEDEYDRARTLDATLLTAYQKAWKKLRAKPPNRQDDVHQELLRILKVIVPEKGGGGDDPKEGKGTTRWWQTMIEGTLSTTAMNVLKDNADWYKGSEPELVCFPSQPSAFYKVKEGDYAIVFDFSAGAKNGWLRSAKILGRYDFPATDDGTYFLAIKYRRGRKKLTKGFVSFLLESGFVKKKRAIRKLCLRKLPFKALRIIADDIKLKLRKRDQKKS